MIELGIPLAIALTAAAAAMFRRGHGVSRRAWRDAAEELGLEFEDGDAPEQRRIVGRVHGHELVVRCQPVARDGHKTHHTSYELAFERPLSFGLRLHAEGLLSGLGKLVGLDDTEVGDPQFDQRVQVDTDDPAAMRLWLTDARRTRIRRFLMGHTQARIDDRGLRWAAPYLHTRRAVITQHVRELVRTADLLTGRPERAERPAPADRAARGPTSARTARPDASSPGARPAAPEPDPLVDPEAVAAALFDEGLAGLETGQRFEDDFADRPVRWQGTLRTLEPVTVDFVFGDGPFTRATLDLRHGDADALGARRLRAVVRLPAGDRERLRPAIDRWVSFTGRLVSFDPFARSLYVDDGRIE